MKPWLISVFDLTGNASEPFRKAGWDITQIDIQRGIDFMTWDFIAEFNEREEYGTVPEVGIIAMIPCTDYATSGAKHFAAKDKDGRTAESQKLVARVKKMIFFFDDMRVLKFWMVENPRTRIHTLNPWLKPIHTICNPCDYAGYDPVPKNSRYNKETWLFGRFNKMKKKYMKPLQKENPGWKNFGGKSLKTKNARSESPLGLCNAFAEANS